MYILVDEYTNVIIAKCDYYEEAENGKFINGVIYPMGEIFEIPDSTEVVPLKYKYINGEVVLNEDYIPPINNYEKIEELKQKVELQQRALDDLIMNVIPALMGGEM